MQNWAIVIGIDKYWTQEACLKGAVRDALKMREWLVRSDGGAVPSRNVYLLLDRDTSSPSPPTGVKVLNAKRDSVIDAIEDLLKLSHGQAERLFFYFAGHGIASCIHSGYGY
jgi:uncharacterized caspase-like protein